MLYNFFLQFRGPQMFSYPFCLFLNFTHPRSKKKKSRGTALPPSWSLPLYSPDPANVYWVISFIFFADSLRAHVLKWKHGRSKEFCYHSFGRLVRLIDRYKDNCKMNSFFYGPNTVPFYALLYQVYIMNIILHDRCVNILLFYELSVCSIYDSGSDKVHHRFYRPPSHKLLHAYHALRHG